MLQNTFNDILCVIFIAIYLLCELCAGKKDSYQEKNWQFDFDKFINLVICAH